MIAAYGELGKKGKTLFKHNTDIGQNFLRDRSVVKWMVDRAHLTDCDRVLEIGPGEGILTLGILGTPCSRLDAIELDTRLRVRLEAIAAGDARLALHWGDAVRFDYASLPSPPTQVIANLPYHITTPLIWTLLERLSGTSLGYMLLMVQREAANRLAAGEKSRETGPLGITLAALGEVTIARGVSRGAFFPMPSVDSAIVEIRLSGNAARLPRNRAWRRLLTGSFAQRRKTLINNWASLGISRAQGSEILASHRLPPLSRPEELRLETWLELYDDDILRKKLTGGGGEVPL